MDGVNFLFLITALLLFVSVIATRASTKLGMPLLLVFLGVGMLAGEQGIGGIKFDNYSAANTIGQLALAVILLDGGLRTNLSSFRIALKPSAVLASYGVIATVVLLGIFATLFLGVDWKHGMLMAAIVGSTDAGAVFSLLRTSGVRLNSRVMATLELESGCNDPMAILMVTALIMMIMQPQEADALTIGWLLVKQLGLGLILGWLAGKVLAHLLARIRLADGLYALLVASGGLMLFASTNLLGGSGFLAVYLAGVFIGNSHTRAIEHVFNVMDGLAWLAQASMFLVLGLLVTPSRLLDHGIDALVIAFFLTLVARPIAVWTSLKFFRYTQREKAYISWVGLRGAVPITLAIMPLTMGVPQSELLFEVAFAVVILSLMIQGSTISVVARLLKVVLPPRPEPLYHREIWLSDALAVSLQSFKVGENSDAEDSHPDVMTRNPEFNEGRLFALIRRGETVPVDMQTKMAVNDIAWYVLPENKGNAFAEQFSARSDTATEQQFYGEFILNPDIKVGDLAFAYGLHLNNVDAEQTLVELFIKRFGSVPVSGDRIHIDGFEVTVKELGERSQIKTFGLKIPNRQASVS